MIAPRNKDMAIAEADSKFDDRLQDIKSVYEDRVEIAEIEDRQETEDAQQDHDMRLLDIAKESGHLAIVKVPTSPYLDHAPSTEAAC